MMFKTHFAFSILIGLILVNRLQANRYIFILLLILGSILPDIDNPKSKIAKKLPIISAAISIFSDHRGFFHSIFPVIILAGILFFINQTYALAISIGYLSHLLLDSLTKTGIKYFYPFPFLNVKGFIKTGSFFEFILFIIITSITTIYILQNI